MNYLLIFVRKEQTAFRQELCCHGEAWLLWPGYRLYAEVHVRTSVLIGRP